MEPDSSDYDSEVDNRVAKMKEIFDKKESIFIRKVK
jgi:hypothetical protein